MLALRREMLSLTQTELAALCALSQGLISKVEAGLQPLPEDAATEVARVLNVPVEFFFAPLKAHGYGSACTHHRKRSDVAIKRLRAIQAKVNLIRFQISRLLDGVEITTARQFSRLPIDEFGQPAEIARLVRATWGLPMGPVENLSETIEAAGGVVVLTEMGSSRVDALSQWVEDTPPLMFLNRTQPGDRLRWTLAHEVGHLVMHEHPTPDQETQADAFAAELLMPAREIVGELEPVTLPHLAQLKLRWRVSIAALLRRAHDLELVTDSQYRRLFTRYNMLGYRHGEPAPIGVEQPSLIKTVLRLHIEEHGYTMQQLATRALVHVEEFLADYVPEQKSRLTLLPQAR
jgi:Zn-dependent peptidase ImmA (M78 family)/transcriptional regulator with XRE-family HTH domain